MVRLNAQYNVFVENTSHLLPPSIPDHESPNAVADVASGSGWAFTFSFLVIGF